MFLFAEVKTLSQLLFQHVFFVGQGFLWESFECNNVLERKVLNHPSASKDEVTLFSETGIETEVNR